MELFCSIDPIKSYFSDGLLAGIRGVRTGGLRDSDLESLRTEIETRSILFPLASSTVTAVQAGLGKTLAGKAEQWISGAVAIGKAPRVEVIGCTDSSGTEERNQGLSQQRAERIAELLLAGGVRREMLAIQGNGTCSTPAENTVDAALRRNVTLRLFLDPASQAGARAR